jgi:hypothetical protein
LSPHKTAGLYYIPGASKYWIFELQTQKRSILGVGVEKRTLEWLLPFLTFRTVWSGKKRSKSTFKKRSKPFGSVLELKKVLEWK